VAGVDDAVGPGSGIDLDHPSRGWARCSGGHRGCRILRCGVDRVCRQRWCDGRRTGVDGSGASARRR